METRMLKRRLRQFSLLACFFVASPLMAENKVVDPSVDNDAGGNTGTYYWYDGGKRQESQLAPQLLADFGGNAAAERTLATAAFSAPLGGPRIYRLDGSVAAMRSQALPGTSPVFRDHGGHGRMRALPGNVVVQFDTETSDEMVTDWAQSEGLVVLRKLSFGNYYLIESPSGLASLELANRLQESGSVLNAQPNWWTEVVTR